MNLFGKTASEIANELNISRQAVYKRLQNDNELRERLRGLTTTYNGRTYYPTPAETILKAAFVNRIDNQGFQNGSQVVDDDSQECQPNSQEISTQQAMTMVIDELRRQLDIQRDANAAQLEQLRAKDNQIAALQSTVNELTSTIQQNARPLEAQAAALTAAQALHAADKKQLMEIDANSNEPADNENSTENKEPQTLRERFRTWREQKKAIK